MHVFNCWLIAAADLQECSVSLASHQVRVHRTHSTQLHLRVRSNPIIEHCTAVRVAEYKPLGYVGAAEAFSACALGEEVAAQGLWAQVQDFDWLRSSPSPNWYASWLLSLHCQPSSSLREVATYMQHLLPAHALPLLKCKLQNKTDI